jgi:hypothetical protein
LVTWEENKKGEFDEVRRGKRRKNERWPYMREQTNSRPGLTEGRGEERRGEEKRGEVKWPYL